MCIYEVVMLLHSRNTRRLLYCVLHGARVADRHRRSDPFDWKVDRR